MSEQGGLKHRIQEAMKAAMRSQEKERLGTIRLIQADIKQYEMDENERVALTDEQVLTLLDKMIRQRKESIKQFEAANRKDLSEKEAFEIRIIQEFLPTPLTPEALKKIIEEAISNTSAASIKDMGKVMAQVKPKVLGRADIGEVGNLVKSLLS